MIREFITRKITREYNNILMGDAEVGADGNFKVNASNAEKANDYLVKAMTGKTQEEIDEMNQKDFDTTIEEINKMRAKKK